MGTTSAERRDNSLNAFLNAVDADTFAAALVDEVSAAWARDGFKGQFSRGFEPALAATDRFELPVATQSFLIAFGSEVTPEERARTLASSLSQLAKQARTAAKAVSKSLSAAEAKDDFSRVRVQLVGFAVPDFGAVELDDFDAPLHYGLLEVDLALWLSAAN